jgi:acetyltransferase-like isoleucine patch superfamily enzyme
MLRTLRTRYWRLRGLRSGPGSVIRRRVTVINPRGLELGDAAHIGPGCYVKCVPGTIHLGARASLGEGTWVSSTKSVIIEANAMVGPGCHITDANHGFARDELIRRQPRIASPVVIGNDAWLGAGAKVLAGVQIGQGAVIGAGAVVTSDIPAYSIAVGVPARVVGTRS